MSSANVDGSAFRVISLNLGGRNTNPVEFVLKGDNSERALEATAILRKAGNAIRSAKEGPLLMPASEMEVMLEILNQIFKESETDEGRNWHAQIQDLLRRETWAQVLASVRETSPHLFNAFNLYTLRLSRPSVWENPATCEKFTNAKEFLIAWKDWYGGLDRGGQFWQEDAPRVASKRGLDVPTAFAGLLLFDVMCLCAARCSMPSAGGGDGTDGVEGDVRQVPFKEISRFAAALPASSLLARHEVAQKFAQEAHALLAQEARSFADHPTIAEQFLPPFCALDGFTAIFLRRDSFNEATDISVAVMSRMEELVDAEASEGLQRAWRTSLRRLAAVFCRCHARLGGFRVCLISLHMSKSDSISGFVKKLRDVLADYDADINAVGMDSNCAAKDVYALQEELWDAGFAVGCTPNRQQVTVAKQRTAFQTQTWKDGDVDISHKDYIVSWTAPRLRRGPTTYTPDLRSSYGVDQETKQCVRLPTTQWPFDHCGVATSFQRRRMEGGDRRLCRACLVALLILLVLASPLASPEREGPYGQPGMWFHDGFMATPRFGICEARAPCPENWVQEAGYCYKTTPKLGYPDVQRICESSGGAIVTVGSEAENQLLLRSLCPQGDFCYIGLLGDFSGTSYWASGEELNYTQLVEADESFLTVWENSRSTDYVVTLLSNMPGDVGGCDVRFAYTFTGGPTTVADVARGFVAPFLAMVWSGIFLAQRRPRQQRLASALLLLAFSVNFLWSGLRVLDVCFVDSFDTHESVNRMASFVAGSGHAATSTLGLWMVVRRMCVLYPSAAFKQIFWAYLPTAAIFLSIHLLFVDWRAPFAATPAVLISVCAVWVACAFYVMIGVQASRRLYWTWKCLYKEATSGCNANGTTLREQVRAAKFHLLAVPLATLTGAARWGMLATAIVGSMLQTVYSTGAWLFVISTVLDSATNDFCAHVFAVMNMDEAIIRTKGITTEVAERAKREVEQHRLAVRILKAAPTSTAQLHQFAILEEKATAAVGSEQEASAFLILKSAVLVETARIHKLMHCVCIRAMTMQMRYQFLIDVPALDGIPRQHVPDMFTAEEEGQAAAENYFNWLYGEAGEAQQVLFQEIQGLLAKFNRAVWPSDLGLRPEEFPWRIWAGSDDHIVSTKALQECDVISPGSHLIRAPARTNCLAWDSSALCIVLEEISSQQVLIQRSGMKSPEEVPRGDLRNCCGGGVFIPGPLKKRQRSLDKIVADYKDTAAWPAAASLVDICRCMLLCDDPYAIAVLVAFLRQNMTVVRVKNRFSEDILEPRAAEELQEIFYAASAASTDARMPESSGSSRAQSAAGYRDISINVVVRTPAGTPFVSEIQMTLSNLAILKNADQNLYAIRRMKSPVELARSPIFREESEVGGRHTGLSARSTIWHDGNI